MCRKRTASDVLKTAAGLSAAGILMATSCGSQGLRAIGDGLLAVAGSLDNGDSDDDINFGEFLLMELND